MFTKSLEGILFQSVSKTLTSRHCAVIGGSLGGRVGLSVGVLVADPGGVVGVSVGGRVGVGVGDSVIDPLSSQSRVPSILHETVPEGKATKPISAVCPLLNAGTLKVATKLPLIYTFASWLGSSLVESFRTVTLPSESIEKTYFEQSHAADCRTFEFLMSQTPDTVPIKLPSIKSVARILFQPDFILIILCTRKGLRND